MKSFEKNKPNKFFFFKDFIRFAQNYLPIERIAMHMGKSIKINKGLDIRMIGEAEKVTVSPEGVDTIVIKPTDFHFLVPKCLVNTGDEVKAGTPLFYSKKHPEVKICSPVSGEVVEVVRGAKRKLMSIKILADKETRYIDAQIPTLESASKEEIISALCENGLWPYIKQRPFDVIANPSVMPKGIFISAFDSNPLAPDLDFAMQGYGPEFQKGLDALAKIAKVHLTVHTSKTKSDVFLKANNVEIHTINGPHPSGNAGIQIHHIDPINKGEVAWTINAQDVAIMGRLFTEKRYNAIRVVAVTGSEVNRRRYAKVITGTPLKALLLDNINTTHPVRIISGNVLTGTQESMEGNLSFYDNQVTVIPEGFEPQFFGWILPGFNKFSLSKSFFSWLSPSKKYDLNTSLNGEERAFVVTGEYEKVFPMNIYPVYLLKSILANDIEKMEELGIYEVAPEDFALCEFVCTSKIDTQSIVREGLDTVMIETE